jgi:predicted MFS family arabinose efflux permease
MLFGIISGMVGVGLILGTSLITRIVGKRPQPSVVLVGLLITGVATSVLGVSYYGWEAAVSMFILGFAVSLVLIPAQTMSQQETPVEMAGRVSSTFMSMISIAQILGLLVSGTLAEKLGIRQLFFSCTAFLIVIATAGWIYLRSRVPAPSVPATE